MKHLKSFVSFTAPMVIMLITFCIYLLINKVVVNYKQNITNDYSIIVVSNTPFSKINNIADIKIKNIKILERKDIIKDIKGKLSESSLKLLNEKLPYFYQIYLEEFPTTYKLDQIKEELSNISNVKRVETFSNNHNKIYSLLLLIQNIIMVLFILMLMLSFLLISKQIKIWFFEQSERISIIQFHGGSLLYSSKPIIKVMAFSTLFSIVFIGLISYITFININLLVKPEIVTLIPKLNDMQFDILKVILLAFIIPLITFFGLSVQHKIK